MPRKFGLSRADFTHLTVKKRLRGELFSLSVGTIPGLETPKFACVVSKKVSPRASERNTLRRRWREAARREAGLVKTRSALIFHALPTARAAPLEKIRADVASLLERVTTGAA